MADRDVTALVLNFRTPERTLDCLYALAKERISRILVIDNSADGGKSLKEMEIGLDDIRASGTHIEVIISHENMGFARGVNLGISSISKRMHTNILLINSDACLEDGALWKLAEALDSAMVVLPEVRKSTGAPVASLQGFYQPLFALITRRRWWGSVRYPSGCCLLFRADFPLSAPFDQDFFFYGEDVMFGHTLRQNGISVKECKDAVVLHAGSSSAKIGSIFYEYHINRGHWLLAIKLSSNIFLRAVFLVMRCLMLPARTAVRCFRFRSFVPLHGLLAASVDIALRRCRDFMPSAE